ncbi:glutamine--fructose-6-phosphate transaminase (isomerizing) [Streptococcus pacificus]|uniref:Glutamine--fructose-6-phosphate aminotransferase [isomerizing] n=1 Tax=Streptococcus pacificus TaxID=2740577 RepID=A0ABS0ZI01_9STRE|nr:glutamine--fructose-6-phosphate transaminase (isomerizing) [Streptococcus pacificus]MBJ8325607.1 glutamine--fructose-6-phosphate transaminase (isomerizing) [Streptococcus pacificus]
MCGIVGVVGNRNAKDILMQGLEKLEYRGYDSSGIFLVDGNKSAKLIKAFGKIADLREKIGIDLAGDIGIGHTRWATHGKPSVENAHPHQSSTKELTLVHNGVIENYLDLKETYLTNHAFLGSTDTEIVVHLIEQLAKENSLTTYDAFKKALTIIEGSYAFALVDSKLPDTIYVAKNKSPLLIGLGDGYNMVCSDAMAMIRETSEFMEIHDKEIVTVKKDSIRIEDFDSNPIERESYTASLDLSDIGKGTYPYYMLKEIDEQPSVMRRLIKTYSNDNQEIVVDDAIIDAVKASDRLYIIAAGTSYHAGYAAKQFLEQLTQTPVELGIASEWGYDLPLMSEKPMVILLSQSGETADSRQVLVKANELGIPSLTITNVAGSTLSREANYTMLIHAGPEIAVASTKAYTAQIATLAFLAKAVGDKIGNPKSLDFDLIKELSIVAQSIESTLSQKEVIEKKTQELLETTRNAFYIGRSNDYYVAMEASLKLKEISYIQCEGFAAGELKHGTISLIEDGTPVIALLSNNPSVLSHTRGNVSEVIARGASVLTIVEEGADKDSDDIVVMAVHPYLSSIGMVVPTQLIAYYASLQRGLDVDKPRNLAKSVTVE